MQLSLVLEPNYLNGAPLVKIAKIVCRKRIKSITTWLSNTTAVKRSYSKHNWRHLQLSTQIIEPRNLHLWINKLTRANQCSCFQARYHSILIKRQLPRNRQLKVMLQWCSVKINRRIKQQSNSQRWLPPNLASCRPAHVSPRQNQSNLPTRHKNSEDTSTLITIHCSAAQAVVSIRNRNTSIVMVW